MASAQVGSVGGCVLVCVRLREDSCTQAVEKKAPKTLLIKACSVGWSPWLSVKRFSSSRETGLRLCGLEVVPVLCRCDFPLGMRLGVNPVFWQQVLSGKTQASFPSVQTDAGTNTHSVSSPTLPSHCWSFTMSLFLFNLTSLKPTCSHEFKNSLSS